MALALLGYSILLSVAVPLSLGLAGPVVERRAMHAFASATAVAIAWAASLLLGFLSLGAAGAAIATLTTLLALAAFGTWRDERELAQVEALLARGARTEAVARLQKSVEELSAEGRSTFAPMTKLGFGVRRLVAYELHEDALDVLDLLEARLGERLRGADASEARWLRARVLLQLGQVPEAARVLSADRRREPSRSPEAQLLEALLEVCRADRAGRPLPEAPVPWVWSPWLVGLAHLVRAHLAAAGGDEDAAARELHGLRGNAYESATLALAQTLTGPATEVARQIQGPSVPYR